MMDIHSFEQRSSSELGHELEWKRNRVIVANRREPNVVWSTANQPVQSAGGGAPSIAAGRESSSSFFGWLFGGKLFSCSGGSSSNQVNRLKSNSSLLSISMQHIDAGPFSSNEWRTSKYTLVNFLPKNLFEQFRRFANFYFLTTAVLQIVLPFSPVGPTTSLLPLIFVVATTSIKQAYEDYLRHKMDKELNNRFCHVLRNKKLIKMHSKDIRVGDFVYVQNNEEIPCDMILLAAGGGGASGNSNNNNDRCYVTTANLDGETSLKSRSCFQILEQIGPIKQLDQTLLVVECEQPNATLYEFSGNLRAPKSTEGYELLVGAISELNKDNDNDNNTNNTNNNNNNSATATGGSPRKKLTTTSGPSNKNRSRSTDNGPRVRHASNRDRQKLVAQTIMSQMSKYRSKAEESNPLRPSHTTNATGFHEIPLDISNILLRASRLRNTSFVYGLAVYTGPDTKLAHNSQVKPNKFSSTESTVNNFLIIAFLILMTFSLAGTIRYKLLFTPTPDNQKSAPFQEVFVAHFLLYNYLIPISLYVTLEFVKFFGTISVVEDKKMKAAVWRTVAAPSLDSASHNHQQHQHQTGLQTQQQESSSKTSLKSSLNRQRREFEKPKCNSSDLNEELGLVEVLFSDKTGTLTENSMRFMACSIGGSVYRSINEQLYQQPAELYRGPIIRVAHRMARVKTNRSALIGGHQSRENSIASSPGSNQRHRAHSSASADDKTASNKAFDHRKIPAADQLHLIDRLDQSQERVVEFFICLCLCSTITINERTPLADCLPGQLQSDNYDYRSASPDEQSLIEAAHAFGVTMCKSNDRECFIALERPPAPPEGRKSKSKSKGPSNAPKRAHDHRSPSPASPSQPAAHSPTPPPPQQHKFRALVEGKHSTDRYIVRHFERLLEFEFSSVRKRMSVVYRDCDNDCLLMITKGSEEILDCLKIESAVMENEIDTILTHFEAFAKSGLRTLFVAKRLLSSAEYEHILAELREAKLSIQNREELTSSAYWRAENGLSLIGTTAVEDTLQDGVPETIANLREAGIKIWLLTGDKVETAISVAYLCKLLDRDMTLFQLVRQQDMQACQRLLASFEHQLNSQLAPEQSQPEGAKGSKRSPRAALKSSRDAARPQGSRSNQRSKSSSSSPPPLPLVSRPDSSTSGRPKFALVADGRSLHYAMKYAKDELARLCKQCSCVLGCRLSPLQKAEVVDMVKCSEDSPITAAIGDGANDVSMIQEAHVGIGISGREGKQAVNCSDFAIGRFQMLNRLLFVHGHLFYHRTANIIHYFFYKNFLFILPQFLYSCYNFSSTESLYHPILLIGFNLFFTSLPILVYGLLEVNIAEQALESCPKFYTSNRANSQLKLSVFFSWLMLAALQSLLSFYLIQLMTHLLDTGGQRECLNGFAVILYFVIILTATVRLYSMAYSHNFHLNLSTAASCLVLPGILYGYSLMNLQAVISDNSLYGQVQYYMGSTMFWLTVGTITAVTIAPDLVWFIRDRMVHFKWIQTIMSHHQD